MKDRLFPRSVQIISKTLSGTNIGILKKRQIYFSQLLTQACLGKVKTPPHSFYTSSADLTVIAYNEDLDDSHEAMLETRKEVEKDLQRLANKFL